MYRCRKCRMFLCSAHNVIPVDAARGHRLFRDFWKALRDVGALMTASGGGDSVIADSRGGAGGGGAKADPSSPSSSIFVEPMSWMAPMVGEIRGKLHCPGSTASGDCNSRLGSFNWSGGSEEGMREEAAAEGHMGALSHVMCLIRDVAAMPINSLVFGPNGYLDSPAQASPTSRAAG